MSGAQSVAETPKRKNLNDAERSAVIAKLFKGSNNRVLRKGDFGRVAELYGSNRWTIAGLWKDNQRQRSLALCVLICTTSVAEIAANAASPQTLPSACVCSFMLLEKVLNVPVTVFYIYSSIPVSPGHPLTFFCAPSPSQDYVCTVLYCTVPGIQFHASRTAGASLTPLCVYGT